MIFILRLTFGYLYTQKCFSEDLRSKYVGDSRVYMFVVKRNVIL